MSIHLNYIINIYHDRMAFHSYHESFCKYISFHTLRTDVHMLHGQVLSVTYQFIFLNIPLVVLNKKSIVKYYDKCLHH